MVERAFDFAAEGETAEGDEEFAMGHHEDACGAFGAAGGVVGVHGVEDADPVAAGDGDGPWVAPVEDGHEFPCGFEGHADGLEVRACQIAGRPEVVVRGGVGVHVAVGSAVVFFAGDALIAGGFS